MKLLTVGLHKELEQLLSKYGHWVTRISCGSAHDCTEKVLDFLASYDYYIVVVDFDTAVVDIEEIRCFRRTGKPCAIIALRTPKTGQSESDDQRAFLLKGGTYLFHKDKYLSTGIDVHVLMAALSAASGYREHTVHEIITITYKGHVIKIDQGERSVIVNDESVHVTPKVFQLLCFLAKQKKSLIRKQEIYDYIYGDDLEGPKEKIIDVFVCLLRKALAKHLPDNSYIETDWAGGIRIYFRNCTQEGELVA